MQPKLDIEKTRERIHAPPLRDSYNRSLVEKLNSENVRIQEKLKATRGHYSRESFRRDAGEQEKMLEKCRKFRPSSVLPWSRPTSQAYSGRPVWESASGFPLSAPATSHPARNRFASLDGMYQHQRARLRTADALGVGTPDSMSVPIGLEGTEPVSNLFTDDLP